MKRLNVFLLAVAGLISTGLISISAWAAPPLLCVIQPESEAEVGSPVVGVVQSVRVERGDQVRKGQVLAKLRSQVEAASLRVAKTRAQADADVRAAQAEYQFLKQQQIRSEELYQQNFISKAGLEKSRAETQVAAEKLAQAQKQLDVWKHEVELAEARLELRAIRAPFSGVITERFVTVGERIEDKPMFRIARVHPLRVEVVAPASLFGTIDPGMVAKVTPDLPNFRQLDAEVVLVDQFVDAASNTFRVRASLPNVDGKIPSGSRCTAQLMEQAKKTVARPMSETVAPELAHKLHVDLRLDSELTLPASTSAPKRRAK